MTFDEWIAQQGEGDASGIALARSAWEAAQNEERVDFYPRAHWAAVCGRFSPKRLREIATRIERGSGGPKLH